MFWRDEGSREGFFKMGVMQACLKAEGKQPESREVLRREEMKGSRAGAAAWKR